MKLIRNLPGVLTEPQIAKIHAAVSRECSLLFNLATSHFDFAKNISADQWRQRVSRLYYAAYNAKRALVLRHDGSFSTESSDHQKVEQVPAVIESHSMFGQKLKNLRDDRNLADYSHIATCANLLMTPDEAEKLVGDFIEAVRGYLEGEGVDCEAN